MKKDINIYLDDIIDSIDKIEEYLKGLTYESFENEYHWQDAVMRRLEIIGEAASKLPQEYIDVHQNVEWKKMKGVRNIIIHAYSSVDLKQVWEIVTVDLPLTKIQIEKLLIS